MKHARRHLLTLGILAAAMVCGATAHADTVAAMNFGTAADNAKPDTTTVKMDSFNKEADGEMKLQGNGSQVTKIDTGSTGISDKWDKALQAGYLEVAGYANYNKLDQVGICTTQPARAYFYGDIKGYGDFGDGTDGRNGGTIYIVFQPTANWAKSRRGLFGSGAHPNLSNSAGIGLYCRDGTLYMDCASNSDGDKETSRAKITGVKWDTSKWYFVAASWQIGQPPVLYLRELSADGPAASPAAINGTVMKSDKLSPTVPGGYRNFPFLRPMAIGARYVDNGGARGTFDGAGAKIAWFRLDNVYDQTSDIDTIFLGLAAK